MAKNRARPKVKLYRRPSKDGKFSWVLRWRENGRQYLKTLVGVTDEELAKEALGEQIRRIELGARGLPTDPGFTLAEALADYNAHRAGLITAERAKLHEARANTICGAIGGAVAVKEINKGHVSALRRHLSDLGRTPNTINEHTRLLSAAINYAVACGKIARNPVADVGKVSDPRAPRWRFLDHEEIDKLMDVLENGFEVEKKSRSGNTYKTRIKPSGPAMRNLIVFLLNTGARLGEALACTWRDIDLKRGQVRLVSTKRASGGRAAAVRYVPINAALRDLLKELAEAPHTATDPVLTISRNNLRRKFENLCQRAGLGHVRIHDLRHSFCSHLAMAGVPIPTIQALAGHATIAMTMRYSHLLPGAAQAGVDALNFGARGGGAKVVDVAEAAG